jgi:hypothetical protein
VRWAANKLTIHILAAVAEHEREAISERTKGALAAAKARGKQLGTPDPAGVVERMRVARTAQAAQLAANVLPIIRDIQAAGHTSLNAIAGQLNARKVATANGGQWRHVQVRQILNRLASRRGENGWSIDINYRPKSYFGPQGLESFLISKVKGAVIRDKLEKLFVEGRHDEIQSILGAEGISPADVKALGAVQSNVHGG